MEINILLRPTLNLNRVSENWEKKSWSAVEIAGSVLNYQKLLKMQYYFQKRSELCLLMLFICILVHYFGTKHKFSVLQ